MARATTVAGLARVKRLPVEVLRYFGLEDVPEGGVDIPYLDEAGRVLGCLPPEVLGELHDERGREDGFIHRILFSWPEHVRGGWRSAEPDRFIVGEYAHLIGKLLELDFNRDEAGIRPVVLQMTAEARGSFANFCNSLADRLDDDAFPDSLRGPAAKMEGYCARLALVLHLARQAGAEMSCPEVDGTSVHGAVKLCEYFLAHAERVYPHLECRGLSRLERDADAVVGWILRHRDVIEEDRPNKPAGTFTFTMLLQDLSRFAGRNGELENTLEVLVARGVLREEARPRTGKPGRPPRPVFRVHPEIRLENLENLDNSPRPAIS